jgi:SanA protein
VVNLLILNNTFFGFQREKRFMLFFLLFISVVATLVYILPTIFVQFSTYNQILPEESLLSAPVAVVFGAGLRWDGSPTDVLRDRVAVATELYASGRVEYLLLSGDNSSENYNEPAAMRDYAISLGIPSEAIVLDYAGRRTYDTCYRAKYIFGITDAILVTQRFHLPRALFICNQLGLTASGVSADLRSYRAEIFWRFREMLATTMALVDLWVTHPLPILGIPEPILFQNSQSGPIHATNNSEYTASGGYFESGSSTQLR